MQMKANNTLRHVKVLAVTLLLCSAVSAPASGQLEVLGSYYRPDTPFPQFAQFWGGSSQVEKEAGSALGASVHVFVRNTGEQPLEIKDVLLEGVSLKQAIAFSDQRKFKKVAFAASIYFSDLPKAERDSLIAAGEPVWWKVEPESIPPAGTAQAVVRLRRAPSGEALRLGLRCADGVTEVSVPVKPSQSRVESISFSPTLDQVYLYLRHAEPGKSPSRILMDGRDITSRSSVGRDANLDTVPVVCKLEAPLARASFHCFQAVYEDGSAAIGGIRAWADETAYGLWGAKPGKESDVELARAHVKDMGVHNINLQMEIIGSDAVRVFMNSSEGRQMLKSLGIREIVSDPEKARTTPLAYYLADEPDTADFKVTGVPPRSKVGCLGQGLIKRGEELRKVDPKTPNMVNVDMTFKPDNWYTYGQLPDIFAADPYYQTRLAEAYWKKPDQVTMYSKATFVYAVGSVCQSACAPKPLHLILNCTRLQREGRKFRFGTPQEKRIEVYYSLAAGAKSLSYWWFIPIAPDATGSCGCGADEPEAKALWDEIGLLGAEVRTAGPIIVKSCPADVPVKAPTRLWVRSLLSGLDTLVILCVNDDYLNDQRGTTFRPVENAFVIADLPSWLQPTEVFEISHKGIQDVSWNRQGSQVSMGLGTVEITRFIVVTADGKLRESLRTLYDARFASNVQKLTAKP